MDSLPVLLLSSHLLPNNTKVDIPYSISTCFPAAIFHMVLTLVGGQLVMKVLSHSSYVVLQPDPQQSFTKLIGTAVCGFPLTAGSSSSMFLV